MRQMPIPEKESLGNFLREIRCVVDASRDIMTAPGEYADSGSSVEPCVRTDTGTLDSGNKFRPPLSSSNHPWVILT